MTDVKPKIIFDPAGDEAYTSSNEEVQPLTVESLERMADEIAATLKGREPLKLAKPMRIVPPPEMKFAQLLEWHRTKMHEVCGIPITHGVAMDYAKIRQDFRKRTHTDLDIVKVDLGDGIYVVRPPKPPVNKDAFFDHVKRFARENRIARNQRSADTGCVPVGREEYFRWLREDRLVQAIERTQLPHATTIHERIMPYRVKG